MDRGLFNVCNEASNLKEKSEENKCEICGNKFSRPSHLVKHLKVHDTMKFKCDYCSQVFMKQSILLSHLSSAHKNDEKLYKCKVEGCDREFISKMYHDLHIAKMHADKQEKNLYCFECKKQFPVPWLKKQHDEIKHKGNELYKCLFENCGKTFSNSSKLHRHSQIHLKEKKFRCDVQSLTVFNSQPDFEIHNLVSNHSPDSLPSSCFSNFIQPVYQDSSELVTLLESDLNQEETQREHIININSDDEEYTACTVVLENLFGSARTDYKSNNAYIQKYRSKRKAQKEKLLSIKRVKSFDSEEVDYLSSPPSFSSLISQSPSSSFLNNSSLESIKSTLKQTLTSKKQLKRIRLTNSLSLDLDYNEQTKSDQNDLIDNSDTCFINSLDF